MARRIFAGKKGTIESCVFEIQFKSKLPFHGSQLVAFAWTVIAFGGLPSAKQHKLNETHILAVGAFVSPFYFN